MWWRKENTWITMGSLHSPFISIRTRCPFLTFLQLLEGLARLHDAGYAHGNLCPSSILMENGFPKFVGLCHLVRADSKVVRPFITIPEDERRFIFVGEPAAVADKKALGFIMCYMLGQAGPTPDEAQTISQQMIHGDLPARQLLELPFFSSK